jgi:type IV pilus assembly protein PilC
MAGHAVRSIRLILRCACVGWDWTWSRFQSIKKSTLMRTRRVTRKELITFCFHMDQLMRAGVPIIDALTDLRDTVENDGFKAIVASVLEDVEGGLEASDAMAEHPQAFDQVFVALIRTGEQAASCPKSSPSLPRT